MNIFFHIYYLYPSIPAAASYYIILTGNRLTWLGDNAFCRSAAPPCQKKRSHQALVTSVNKTAASHRNPKSTDSCVRTKKDLDFILSARGFDRLVVTSFPKISHPQIVSSYSVTSHQVGICDSRWWWQSSFLAGMLCQDRGLTLDWQFPFITFTIISVLDCRGKWRRIHCPGSVYLLIPQNLHQHLHFHVSRQKNPMSTSPTILYGFTQWARRILCQIRNL